jgi:hypothetical protein
MTDLDIRRPELKDAPRVGTVRWYDDEKGYGRITADDGEVLFGTSAGSSVRAFDRSTKATASHSRGAEASSTTDATSPRTYAKSPSSDRLCATATMESDSAANACGGRGARTASAGPEATAGVKIGRSGAGALLVHEAGTPVVWLLHIAALACSIQRSGPPHL